MGRKFELYEQNVKEKSLTGWNLNLKFTFTRKTP